MRKVTGDMVVSLRNRFDRRRVDRRGIKPEELLYAETCLAAECRFQGVQPAVPECGLEAVILFADHYGSTCGLKISQFNLEAVRQRVAESDDKWERLA